ncbi:hypothetical protein BTO20_11495 [Mycobacterium dioxanotrophicus]|uniref:Tail assembly chaperone n=1 Tax=Mycobacterium dioxanotrophicus TaxID=482462 RepID=A0A1Y0C1T2_9MYCO|nr:hypothetical protein [Mycobacterium dioxanotrophicus]ART69122.1 hypothetical protein BTO20_11495 [Mycobacterium dioxanotrophicus]
MSDDDKHPIKPEAAAAQATDYLGFMGSAVYDLGEGETWTLPNPNMMPPAMKNRYLEHLRFMAEDLDTDERKDPITGEMRPVQKFPIRHGGKLINDEELLAIALMGTDAEEDRAAYLKDGTLPAVYAKFLKAGGVPGQLNTAWQMMERQLRERMKQDSKSS